MSDTDRLVTGLTAFSDWNDLLMAMRSGYVPTLSHTKKGEKLANIIEAHGFRVYMPQSRQPQRS